MSSSEDKFKRIHWSVPAAHGLARNVSNSRKMLKFLNFVEYVQKAYIYYLFKSNKPLFTKIIV